jgi:hypothetical protein
MMKVCLCFHMVYHDIGIGKILTILKRNCHEFIDINIELQMLYFYANLARFRPHHTHG